MSNAVTQPDVPPPCNRKLPMHRENPASEVNAFPDLEAALCDACQRALLPGLTIATLLALYRSVVGLTRSLRQARQDVGLPASLFEDLRKHLDAVRDTASEYFLESDLQMNEAVRLHRALTALSRAAHLARVRPARVRRPKADQNKPPRVASQRQSKLLSTTFLAALLSPAPYKAKSPDFAATMLEAPAWLDHARPFQRADLISPLTTAEHRASPLTVAHQVCRVVSGFLADRDRDFGMAAV